MFGLVGYLYIVIVLYDIFNNLISRILTAWEIMTGGVCEWLLFEEFGIIEIE